MFVISVGIFILALIFNPPDNKPQQTERQIERQDLSTLLIGFLDKTDIERDNLEGTNVYGNCRVSNVEEVNQYAYYQTYHVDGDCEISCDMKSSDNYNFSVLLYTNKYESYCTSRFKGEFINFTGTIKHVIGGIFVAGSIRINLAQIQ